MTVHLDDDVVPPDLLAAALRDGYVRRRQHPDEPLVVLSYTAKAQYDDRWDAAVPRTGGAQRHR